MVPKLSKEEHFFEFCADFCKKSKSVKAIYICASEWLCYKPWENGIVCFAMAYCFGDIRVWSGKILLNLCWFNIFFDILIANILQMVFQTPINHTIFWKSVMSSFSCLYVNCFKRLRFLAEVSTKFQKMHFFGQFNDHNSIFHLFFPLYDIQFCIWK